MTMTEAVEKLERVDDLFGEISSNLVHVCEELPSLGLSKANEERIVRFCCSFLEHLVEEDRSIQRILNSVKGSVDRVPHTPCKAPDGAAPALEHTAAALRKNIQSMDDLIKEFCGAGNQKSVSPALGDLLRQSGDDIRKTFEAIRAEFGSLTDGWRDSLKNSHQ